MLRLKHCAVAYIYRIYIYISYFQAIVLFANSLLHWLVSVDFEPVLFAKLVDMSISTWRITMLFKNIRSKNIYITNMNAKSALWTQVGYAERNRGLDAFEILFTISIAMLLWFDDVKCGWNKSFCCILLCVCIFFLFFSFFFVCTVDTR